MYFNPVGTIQDYTQNRTEADKKRDPGELGKDQFLRLLTTQLRYQDPINPVKDQEFIAQLAQFSSLEQMQNLNTNLSEMMLAQQKLTAWTSYPDDWARSRTCNMDGERLFGR